VFENADCKKVLFLPSKDSDIMTKKTIFSGFGGQGVLMMGYVLAVAAMRDGKEVTFLPSYGAEVRGGTANCTVVVSDEEIFSPVASSPDYAVIMNRPSLLKYEGMIKEGGVVILNSSMVDRVPPRSDLEVVKVPANDIAKELGSDRTINMIMLGAYVAKTGITSLDSIMNGLTEIVKGKKPSVMKLNRMGLDKGSEYVVKGA
jgi:2-oxoglutarate ferredoxin oxidoreductase subunit gamma